MRIGRFRTYNACEPHTNTLIHESYLCRFKEEEKTRNPPFVYVVYSFGRACHVVHYQVIVHRHDMRRRCDACVCARALRNQTNIAYLSHCGYVFIDLSQLLFCKIRIDWLCCKWNVPKIIVEIDESKTDGRMKSSFSGKLNCCRECECSQQRNVEIEVPSKMIAIAIIRWACTVLQAVWRITEYHLVYLPEKCSGEKIYLAETCKR